MRDDPQRIGEAERRRPCRQHVERHQRAAALHLPPGQLGLRMVVAERDRCTRADPLLLGEEVGDRASRPRSGPRPAAAASRAPFSITQALNGDSAGPVWRRKLWIVRVDERLAGQDHAAEAAALPVDMLGRRIDDAIGAELERALQHRRREDVVDDQRRAARMRDLGHRRDVDETRASDWSGFRGTASWCSAAWRRATGRGPRHRPAWTATPKRGSRSSTT